MTFRQFAVLMVRLQALWLLLYAAMDLIYLPRYVSSWLHGSGYSGVSSAVGRELAFLVFRIALYAGAALVLILHPERVLSWLVKDWVARQPATAGPTPAAGGPQESTRTTDGGG